MMSTLPDFCGFLLGLLELLKGWCPVQFREELEAKLAEAYGACTSTRLERTEVMGSSICLNKQ